MISVLVTNSLKLQFNTSFNEQTTLGARGFLIFSGNRREGLSRELLLTVYAVNFTHDIQRTDLWIFSRSAVHSQPFGIIR